MATLMAAWTAGSSMAASMSASNEEERPEAVSNGSLAVVNMPLLAGWGRARPAQTLTRPGTSRSWLCFVFTHYESLRIIGLVGVRKNPFFLTKIS